MKGINKLSEILLKKRILQIIIMYGLHTFSQHFSFILVSFFFVIPYWPYYFDFNLNYLTFNHHARSSLSSSFHFTKNKFFFLFVLFILLFIDGKKRAIRILCVSWFFFFLTKESFNNFVCATISLIFNSVISSYLLYLWNVHFITRA